MFAQSSTPSAPAQWITLGIAVLGLGGLIFTALKFNRDDTTAIVGQQTALLGNMKALNEELRSSTESLRAERDSLKLQVEHLTGEVQGLRTELREAAGRIERRLDDG